MKLNQRYVLSLSALGKRSEKNKNKKMPELRKMSESEEDVDSRGSMTPSPINELDLAKHPLQNNWTLWYYKNDRSKGWEENQKEVNNLNL